MDVKEELENGRDEALLPSLPAEFKQLEEDGYQVVPGVYSPEECARGVDGIKAWFRGLGTGLDFSRPRSWRPESLPFSIHRIYQHGIGHLQAVWDVRQSPAVYSVFARLWKTRELFVSFDGVSVAEPPEWTGRPIDDKAWLHVDQGQAKRGRHCVQGLVTLEDMNSDDMTLQVLAGSHHYHQEVFRRFGTRSLGDHYRLDEDTEVAWLESRPDVRRVRVEAPKGSLVLFDSRTVHSNVPPLEKRREAHWRFVAFVCMAPARFASGNDVARKVQAFHDQRMTSHWPFECQLTPAKPRFGRGVVVPPTPEPQLRPLGRRLAGLDPW